MSFIHTHIEIKPILHAYMALCKRSTRSMQVRQDHIINLIPKDNTEPKLCEDVKIIQLLVQAKFTQV